MSKEIFENIVGGEEHLKEAVYLIPIDKIRVSEKQKHKISQDKVDKHIKDLSESEKDLLPIDALELEDGTFVIDGNGRHRYFAYSKLGYKMVPLNIKNRPGFKPTKI
jgi:hypothetical protein